jgi:rhamnosyltransferase
VSVVVAVVPTFRPAGASLLPLLDALASQADVVVADDASPCTADPVLAQVAARGIPVVRHAHNAGIARSLNVGLARARETGAAWLLTVDQDSVIAHDHVTRLLAVASASARTTRVGAVGAGRVDDAAGPIAYPVRLVSGIPTTPEVIQTGTLWSVAALEEIGGFDESLGIDAVDAAACVRLRAAGCVIVLAPDVTVAHRIGTSREVSVLGRSVTSTGHSPDRRTTIVRNRLRLAPEEFRQDPVHALRTLRRVAMGTLLAVTVEDDRWAKAKASVRGLFPLR